MGNLKYDKITLQVAEKMARKKVNEKFYLSKITWEDIDEKNRAELISNEITPAKVAVDDYCFWYRQGRLEKDRISEHDLSNHLISIGIKKGT